MREIGKYTPGDIESKWYNHWLEKNYFHAEVSEKEPYTIVIPPPNVTGKLHMGHMLNNTIQDVLIRRARMLGLNACWVPGTDHASIATEAKVVKRLREQGIKKSDLSREDFLKHAWDWTDEYGGIILKQLRHLGASCDWDRTAFTLDETRSTQVIDVFIDLHKKGMIYRGLRMVNWDPVALTAVSDEEVIHKEENSRLYYMTYQIEGSEESLQVATTRPETIFGDTAVCVNPDDERYQHLKGKKVIVPLVGRAVPIIFDDYVDIEFGTGALKVTPAHDTNDNMLGEKHGLEVIDIFDQHAVLNTHGGAFEGMDRFVARKAVAKALDEAGLLVETKDLRNKVGRSERTDAVIEPRLSMQWFLKMADLVKPAIDGVKSKDITLHPPHTEKTYLYWMENIKDWCVSRQLWWGHRIPAWYDAEGNVVVCKTREEAAEALGTDEVSQDEDVMDTWFSSWLWPYSVFADNPEEEDYFYPTNTLVTGQDIIFFWVARMIMAGYQFKGKRPFKDVYFTGMVRDKKRRKMSKQLGNSPDPLDLIAQYGADGVRVGMLMTAPAGNDLLFDEDLCSQGSFFANKVWNAFRLVGMWETGADSMSASEALAVNWMRNRIGEALVELESSFTKYRLSEALMTTYKLVWDDFCSWYLEMVKPARGEKISAEALEETKSVFNTLLEVMHPFMPFITEELWQNLADRKEGETINFASWPSLQVENASILKSFNHFAEVVGGIRTVRNENGIAPKEVLTIEIAKGTPHNTEYDALIKKMANVDAIVEVDEVQKSAFSFVAGGVNYTIPADAFVNVEEEIVKLEEELKYTQGFLVGVTKKLSNERFVANAPEAVVASERKKMSDAEGKIALITQRLEALKG
ncbi:MAG: Valine--tRNA ligase [Flavobacteriales bacterium UBA4585]|nr:MAG: Valine--tRNA ligase [Flavobacteriales bacterium UBA4585]